MQSSVIQRHVLSLSKLAAHPAAPSNTKLLAVHPTTKKESTAVKSETEDRGRGGGARSQEDHPVKNCKKTLTRSVLGRNNWQKSPWKRDEAEPDAKSKR